MKRFFAFGPIRIYLLTGILTGALGTLLFGLVHAVLLVPIWDRVAGGLAFAIPAGILLTWAFDECRAGNGTVRLREGAFFGAVMWALLLPMTGFAAWSRLSGTREVLGTFEVVLELAIAAATAFFSGWFFTRRLRASGALAGALVMVVVAMAGPVPVTNGMTEAALFVSSLPLYVTSGIVLAAVFRRLITWKALPGAVPPSPAEAPRHGTPSGAGGIR